MEVPVSITSYHRSPSPAPPLELPIQSHPQHPRTPSPFQPLKSLPELDTDSKRYDGPDVPVPWKSLFPILLFCVADAATYSVVFPIITDMITSFGVVEDKIGLYSGLGEGVMMLVEAAFATTWSRLGDKHGRRPCILWGFGVTVLAMPLLGVSGAVWQVVLWRALLGLNSTGVLAKTCTAELSHPSNRATIFSILSPAFGIGFVVGTFLGGELAHPYGRLPWWLGGSSEFFKGCPYALPCFVIGSLDAFAILIGYLYLPETQKKAHTHRDEHSEKASRKNLMRDAMKVPSFPIAVAVTCLFQISYFSWDGLFTIFTYTPTDRGGLGLPVDIIGVLYSTGSLIGTISNPLFLPRLTKALGAHRALLLVLMTWPVLALTIPLSQWTAIHVRPLMWIIIGCMLCLKTFTSFAWAMTDIMLMSAFDDYPELLATGSAISLIASAGGRAAGPAVSGWLYSISTTYKTGSLGRQISWIYILCATLPAIFLVQLLPNNDEIDRKRRGGGTSDYEAVPLVETGESSAASWHFEENDEYERK